MRPVAPVALLAVLLTALAWAQPGPDRDELLQVSTLGALMAGVFEGAVTVGDLLTHGDTGLGTFDALDGEMVVLRGRTFRVSADGIARAVAPTERTPFAAVSFMDPELSAPVAPGTDLAALTRQLDALLPSPNLFYLIVVEGRFTRVKTRSVPAQSRPYPVLAKVAAHQPVFEIDETDGTLVGLRCPPFAEGLNLPGYHFHFLDAARGLGGHVLEAVIAGGTATLDATPRLRLMLPDTGDFLSANLRPDAATVERVEGRQ